MKKNTRSYGLKNNDMEYEDIDIIDEDDEEEEEDEEEESNGGDEDPLDWIEKYSNPKHVKKSVKSSVNFFKELRDEKNKKIKKNRNKTIQNGMMGGILGLIEYISSDESIWPIRIFTIIVVLFAVILCYIWMAYIRVPTKKIVNATNGFRTGEALMYLQNSNFHI